MDNQLLQELCDLLFDEDHHYRTSAPEPELLVALAPIIPESHIEKAFDTICHIGVIGEYARIRALAAMLDSLPQTGHDEVLVRLVIQKPNLVQYLPVSLLARTQATFTRVEWKSWEIEQRDKARGVVSQRMDGLPTQNELKQTAQTINLSDLSPWNATEFALYLPFLDETQIATVWEQVTDGGWHSEDLAMLVPFLPEALLSQSIELAQYEPGVYIQDRSRAHILISLAPYLPLVLLPKAIATARAIEEPWWRTQALMALLAHLSEDEQADVAVKAATISDERIRWLWVQLSEDQQIGLLEELVVGIWDHYGGAPPPTEFVEEILSEPVKDNRRLGVDVFVDGKLLEHALIADRENLIEISIGPEGTASAQIAEPINLDFAGHDMLSLPVRFMYDDVVVMKTMHVRRDPISCSSVTFEVTPSGIQFGALIIVYGEDGSTVIEGAAFSAAVVPTEEEQECMSEVITLVRVPVARLTGPKTDTVGSIVTDGERAVAAAPQIPIRSTPEAAVAGVAAVMTTLKTAAGNYVATNGAFDVTPALVTAAQAGYRLRTRCDLDVLRDLDRIQVISFYPQSAFPLELVYDGEPPVDGATKCDGWKQALETGTCPSCRDTTDTDHICPLRFWGLSKVIEHHMGNTTGGIPFTARQYISNNVKTIAIPSSTLISVSEKVFNQLTLVRSPDVEREALIAELLAEAEELGGLSVVNDWKAWRIAIDEIHPNLLVAIPHQDTKDGVPALELGGELETTFVEGYIRKAGEEPGPIILLLGCDTSTAQDLIGSFASDMQQYAPVVIATIGKIVAAEAPFVASIIINSMEHALKQPGATIGTALLAARRALLAKSRVVSLLLVGHGDARWKVAES